MAPTQTSQLSNPLAAPGQLAQSGSQLDGVPADLEDSIRFAGARLTQLAGVLLRLPQDIIAQAIVTFMRFWVGAEGGSLLEYGAKDVSAACLYMVSKVSAFPKSPRSVINVYAYLDSFPSTFVEPEKFQERSDAESYYVSEGTYHALRTLLMRTEAHILRVLGFETHVALPYTICINYLQTLGIKLDTATGKDLARRAFAHLNTALLSPQLMYVTHQPAQIATAAIYLSARQVGVKLPGEEWWEVFDTDREELGFLVVALMSIAGFAQEEKAKWGRRKVPLTLEDVEAELEKRQMLEATESGPA
ncbi:cyclin-like protein [Phyllosticta capitalensis]|uniref:Cyclin-like protein n=1 Tax=Phyllosticta capitalensis TaxID=121624 RepID=A0ABR1Z3B6_9PEZI